MLSVLSTSWQQQHGPGRRRRCGNGAARVAEPAFVRLLSSGGPSHSPLVSVAAHWARVGEGSRTPRARGPPTAGRPGSPRRPGPRGQRCGRGGAAWLGHLGVGPRSSPGRRRKRRARLVHGRAAAGERTLFPSARAQVILNTRCLTIFLPTLAVVFYCLQKDQTYSGDW